MTDFRDRTFEPLYMGPEDLTVIYHITAFGIRRECTEEELLRQFGRENPCYWPESIPQKLTRMLNDGRLIEFENRGVKYYRVIKTSM